MLQAFSDRIKGCLGIGIVVVIAIAFSLWGVKSYLSDSVNSYAAIVDDFEIPTDNLDRAVRNRKQELSSRFGENLPISDAVIKKGVLESLINQVVMQQNLLDSGYSVSDGTLGVKIRDNESFHRDGKFDGAYYENVLKSSGKSTGAFEQEFKNDLIAAQLRDGIAKTAIVMNGDINSLLALKMQSREIELIRFDRNKYTQNIKVTGDEVKSYFEDNKTRFMNPEQLSISYVELTGNQIISDDKVNEDDLQNLYNDYRARAEALEERKARHVLLKLAADATPEEVADKSKQLLVYAEQARAGKSFADIAEKHSEDVGSADSGGDLDWVSRGMMVEPFEKALFAMEPDGISDVVRTKFGVHLIKLDDVRSAEVKSLDQMRDELTGELKQNAIENQFYEMSEQMASLAYENPDNLDILRDEMGLTVSHSELFTRNTGKGISVNEAIREAAFSDGVLRNGVNSDVIEIKPNHIVVLRVGKHIDATPKDIEQVYTVVESEFRQQKARREVRAMAQTARAALDEGQSVNDVLNEYTSVERPGMVRRDSKEQDSAMLNSAFSMRHPVDGKAVYLEASMNNGDAVVIVLKKVSQSMAISDKKQFEALAVQRERDIAFGEYNAYLNSIKAKADIERSLP